VLLDSSLLNNNIEVKILIYYAKGNEPITMPELNIQNAGQEKPDIGY